jgi:hypothetical protein
MENGRRMQTGTLTEAREGRKEMEHGKLRMENEVGALRRDSFCPRGILLG